MKESTELAVSIAKHGSTLGPVCRSAPLTALGYQLLSFLRCARYQAHPFCSRRLSQRMAALQNT